MRSLFALSASGAFAILVFGCGSIAASGYVCAKDSTCPTGLDCLSGKCVVPAADGLCGAVCPDNYACQFGVCSASQSTCAENHVLEVGEEWFGDPKTRPSTTPQYCYVDCSKVTCLEGTKCLTTQASKAGAGRRVCVADAFDVNASACQATCTVLTTATHNTPFYCVKGKCQTEPEQ